MKPLRILSIDDKDFLTQQKLVRVLSSQWEIVLSRSLQDGIQRLRNDPFDVLLLDKCLGPEGSGVAALPELRREFPRLAVIMLTHDTEFNGIQEALNEGASDYIIKSETAISELQIRIPEALKKIQKETLIDIYKEQKKEDLSQEFVGHSPFAFEMKSRILAARGNTSPILITGESGSGKDAVARALWASEGNVSRPFVAINVAALPGHLVESELFGHVRGAFTGAVQDRKGAFMLAHEGDLFLDEMGDLPLPLQAKLLRVVEDKKVQPVGGSRSLPVKVRIISATNKDLEGQVEKGNFRSDLYFRLNVIRLDTIPLRQRPEDIEPIVQHYLRKSKGSKYSLTPLAIQFLKAQKWPGNVRQMLNCVETAIAFLGGTKRSRIDVADLVRGYREIKLDHTHKKVVTTSLPIHNDDLTPGGYANFLRKSEHAYLDQAVQLCQNNIPLTAKKLGLAKSTLYQKLKSFDSVSSGEN